MVCASAIHMSCQYTYRKRWCTFLKATVTSSTTDEKSKRWCIILPLTACQDNVIHTYEIGTPDMELNNKDRILRFREVFLSRVKPSQVKWQFYYDETNNYRRLKVDKALVESCGNYEVSSSLEKNFVIGGIAFANQKTETTFRQDFDACRFPTSIDRQTGKHETKCKQVCIGSNVIQILNNTRVGRVKDFLGLLDRDGLFVHVSTTNAFFYYVTSEIAEKLIWILGKEDKGINYNHYISSIMNMLYDLVRDDKSWFMKTLEDCGYPSMESALDIKKFCEEVNKRVTNDGRYILSGYPFKCDPQSWYMLGRILRHTAMKCHFLGGEANEFLRIGSGSDYIVDSLCDFYWAPCLLWYPSSYHVFDEEPTIEKKLESLLPRGTITNGEMRNSADDKMIQVSDIWVGLYAKYEELLDSYVFKSILPNYKINPEHLSSESLVKEIKDSITADRKQIESEYKKNGNMVAYEAALRGLQNRVETAFNKQTKKLSFPNVDEATGVAVNDILNQLNNTGKQNIRLMSKLIIKSANTDESTYRIEDSETTFRLRMGLIKGLASF